jgi:hypothetical protein
MNEELLVTCALLVQNGALLVSHKFCQLYCNCAILSQPKSAVHQQAAKLFQHWHHLKGNYDLNSAFEKADRFLEQKRTGSQFHYIAPLTL